MTMGGQEDVWRKEKAIRWSKCFFPRNNIKHFNCTYGYILNLKLAHSKAGTQSILPKFL